MQSNSQNRRGTMSTFLRQENVGHEDEPGDRCHKCDEPMRKGRGCIFVDKCKHVICGACIGKDEEDHDDGNPRPALRCPVCYMETRAFRPKKTAHVLVCLTFAEGSYATCQSAGEVLGEVFRWATRGGAYSAGKEWLEKARLAAVDECLSAYAVYENIGFPEPKQVRCMLCNRTISSDQACRWPCQSGQEKALPRRACYGCLDRVFEVADREVVEKLAKQHTTDTQRKRKGARLDDEEKGGQGRGEMSARLSDKVVYCGPETAESIHKRKKALV